MSREFLPPRRQSQTVAHVRPCDAKRFCRIVPKYFITAARFEDGRLGEVFVSSNRPTTEVADIVRDASVILSIAFQYGVPLDVLRHSITRTNDGSAASIIGEVLDVLGGLEGSDDAPAGTDAPRPSPVLEGAV
jgi:hypothetical protein